MSSLIVLKDYIHAETIEMKEHYLKEFLATFKQSELNLIPQVFQNEHASALEEAMVYEALYTKGFKHLDLFVAHLLLHPDPDVRSCVAKIK